MLQGRDKEALTLAKKALDIDNRKLGPETPAVATDREILGEAYSHRHNYDKAETERERAVGILRKLPGQGQAIDVSSCGLAHDYYMQEKYTQAEPLLREALEVGQEAFGPNSEAVAHVAEHLAETLRKLGRGAEAARYEKEAQQIRTKSKGTTKHQ